MYGNQKKDSNPKDALGVKKVPLHAVPVKPLLEVGLAMMEGGRKYGTHNYRAIGVRMSTYYNAAMRHLMAWWEGEDIDADSNVHHLIKAIACLFVVRDSMHMGNCLDDRPVRYPHGMEMELFNGIAKCLIEKYPECAKPFTMHADIKAAGPKSEPHTIPLDELIKELELDEPQFKAGDKVKIAFETPVLDRAAYDFCADAGDVGTYRGLIGTTLHDVRVINGHQFADYTFLDSEITLVEDN